jgi:hypothetical protein
MVGQASFRPETILHKLWGSQILAAAGFQPAFTGWKDSRGTKEPPKRRLQAGLPAPQQMQNTADGKT